MKPCSAWCRPEEGVHALAMRSCASAVALVREQRLGRTQAIMDGADHHCIPVGALVEFLEISAAPEADPPPYRNWQTVVLATVRMLS